MFKSDLNGSINCYTVEIEYYVLHLFQAYFRKLPMFFRKHELYFRIVDCIQNMWIVVHVNCIAENVNCYLDSSKWRWNRIVAFWRCLKTICLFWTTIGKGIDNFDLTNYFESSFPIYLVVCLAQAVLCTCDINSLLLGTFSLVVLWIVDILWGLLYSSLIRKARKSSPASSAPDATGTITLTLPS